MYNPFLLIDKTILVTGATSGIGRSIAIECSKMGAKLIIAGRNIERLKETFSYLEGAGHFMFDFDLTNEKDQITFIDKLPQINGLVHAAGILNTVPFKFSNKKKFLEIFDTNFFAQVELSRLLIKVGKIENESSIVFISSIDGLKTTHIGNTIYSASKAAISSVAKNMALELANKSIRVNSILPGMINTPLIHNDSFSEEELEKEKSNYLFKRFGKPEEVAYAAIYLLSDASKWVTGTDMVIDGGYTIR
jgi:NAD(P)-dependent dehydrogenase (short-subunit alcohol dehydrogenase family)